MTEFTVTEDEGEAHVVGSYQCRAGWCGGIAFPRSCKRCGGLLHAEFVDQTFDGPELAVKCDTCGGGER